MQFNSFEFIFAFIPVFLIVYFLVNRISVKSGRILIILSGLLFFYFAGIDSFILLLISSAINFIFALLIRKTQNASKHILAISILLNVGLLLFYKYIGEIVGKLPSTFDSYIPDSFHNLIMPIGISFFTFQQIMYLVSVYKKEIDKVDVLDYASYILYFPKLVMGPLVEPCDLIKKINDPLLKKVNPDNIAIGIKLFSFGLFKKIILADTFAKGVLWGYSNVEAATSADMLLTMLFYSFEIYFDFSGYSDMAIGISKMINIDLPINFDSPYKATSVRDFWKRWHMSLTGFFTKYIYFPLGGSRKGKIRTYINTMIVFLISGIWHGSKLTFVLWGAIYGVLMVIERLFDKYLGKLSEVVRWIYTFVVVNVLWLLFNSQSISEWVSILLKIVKFQSTEISEGLINSFVLPETSVLMHMFHLTGVYARIRGLSMIIFIIAGFVICLIPNNNFRNQKNKTILNMVLASIAFVFGILCLSSESIFIYNNF